MTPPPNAYFAAGDTSVGFTPCRMLEFLRVAPDEVSRGFGKIRSFPLRGASGLLFADRARQGLLKRVKSFLG